LKSVVKKKIVKVENSSRISFFDNIIVEEPLDIYINSSNQPAIVTMRTPGEDDILALGLLYSNETINNFDDVSKIEKTTPDSIRISIPGHTADNLPTIITHSSCGLCNGRSWEEVSSHSLYPIFDKSKTVEVGIIKIAPTLLNDNNDDFSLTGGNHKVGLLSFEGHLEMSYEDVGRHNAFDKLLGQCLVRKLLPLSSYIAVLSGRCSYELCLKAWQGGIPIIISKGAPTSKAFELADAAGITLIGFAKENSFNIYTHPYRVRHEKAS
jgi:FdhD protein